MYSFVSLSEVLPIRYSWINLSFSTTSFIAVFSFISNTEILLFKDLFSISFMFKACSLYRAQFFLKLNALRLSIFSPSRLYLSSPSSFIIIPFKEFIFYVFTWSSFLIFFISVYPPSFFPPNSSLMSLFDLSKLELSDFIISFIVKDLISLFWPLIWSSNFIFYVFSSELVL